MMTRLQSRNWLWSAAAGLLLIVTVLYAIPAIVVFIAAKRINADSGAVSANTLVGESVRFNAASLARISDPHVLLKLSKSHLADLILGAIDVAEKTERIPVTLSDVQVQTKDQAILFSAKVVGGFGDGITIRGRGEGHASASIDGDTLTIRPAIRKVHLDSLDVKDRWWSPGKLVAAFNGGFNLAINQLNGAIQPPHQRIFPKQIAVPTSLGEKIKFDPIVSMLADESGLQVVTQIAGIASDKPAATGFTYFQKAYRATIAGSFGSAKGIESGLFLGDQFVQQLLGPNATPTVSEKKLASLRAAAEGINKIKGVDLAFVVSASESDRLLGGVLAKALNGISRPTFRVLDSKHEFTGGMLTAGATVEAPVKIGKVEIGTHWTLKVGTTLGIEDNPVSVVAYPAVLDMRLIGITDANSDISAPELTAALNEFLGVTRDTVNKALPRLSIAVPVVAPEPFDIDPIRSGGLEARFTPRRFLPPSYHVESGVAFASKSGLFILVDLGTGKLPERPALASLIQNPTKATEDDVEVGLRRRIEDKYGLLPKVPISGFASWSRFAEFFNSAWADLAPSAEFAFDSGTRDFGSQSVNLVEYAHFDCVRSRQCSRGSCERRSCAFEGCSRRDCDWGCPEREVRGNWPWPAKGSYVIWRGPDPGCEADKARCRIQRETEHSACLVGANTRKAACDSQAELDVAGCNISEEAKVAACNVQAEAEVAACKIKKGLTNAVAEVSGVGRIGGDGRVRLSVKVDARNVRLNPSTPGSIISPVVTGTIRGDVGIDWVPYDVIGHATCPIRGKVFADTTLSFVMPEIAVQGKLGMDSSKTDQLVVQVQSDKFKIPVELSPGVLTSLYANNPQIVVTCPVTATFLVPGLIASGSYRAISQTDIGNRLNTVNVDLSKGPNIEVSNGGGATLATLFGGRFIIVVSEINQRFRVLSKEVKWPDGSTTLLKPSLNEKGFVLAVSSPSG